MYIYVCVCVYYIRTGVICEIYGADIVFYRFRVLENVSPSVGGIVFPKTFPQDSRVCVCAYAPRKEETGDLLRAGQEEAVGETVLGYTSRTVRGPRRFVTSGW